MGKRGGRKEVKREDAKTAKGECYGRVEMAGVFGQKDGDRKMGRNGREGARSRGAERRPREPRETWRAWQVFDCGAFACTQFVRFIFSAGRSILFFRGVIFLQSSESLIPYLGEVKKWCVVGVQLEVVGAFDSARSARAYASQREAFYHR
jgi:hypothetical protein